MKNIISSIFNNGVDVPVRVELQGNVKKDKVYFSQIKSDAIIPSKIDENAGYDVYANFDGDEFMIPSFKATLIPTGIAWASSPKYDFNLKNERGSVGTKTLVCLCGLIDSGFRNEIFVCILNCNSKPVVISKNVDKYIEGGDYDLYPYSKAIAQGKIEIVPEVEVVTIPYKELLNMKSERGLGMLGDSGK
ncbi:MAG: dUTP pyrophosphatase [Candidatus Gracilibacteria bacterium]|nr:dUTP pyrophosphatase [Candidatus Gracilibacteria bacterium]